MTLIVTKDTGGSQSVEATGHPTQCTEPVIGTVGGSEPHSVTVNNSSGQEQSIATYEHTVLNFPVHSHSYAPKPGCHDDSSHAITKSNFTESNWSSNVTISPANEEAHNVLLFRDSIGTDPITGDSVNAIDTGVNNSVTIQ